MHQKEVVLAPIRVTVAQKERARMLSAQTGLTVSEIVRTLLDNAQVTVTAQTLEVKPAHRDLVSI